MPRRISMPLLSFLVGLGLGGGTGLVLRWLLNDVLTDWLGPRVPQVGWGTVGVLALVFAIAMANSARLLVSLYED